MKHLALTSIWLLSTLCQAAEPPSSIRTKQEIAHLFTTLENSGCQFNRNGSWYGAKEASSHLSMKYQYLQGKDLVPSAEAFIERAATQSSLSGKPYQIKCNDAAPAPSGPWFKAELAKYRQAGR